MSLLAEKPNKHTEEPGTWLQGQTWASSIIPQAFFRGTVIWQVLERHLFPREKGRNILRGHNSYLSWVLPALGRLTHSEQCVWCRSIPSTPGPPALETCPAYARAFTSLTRQLTHRNNVNFCCPGEMNSWNQNCIKVHAAEYLQSNLTKCFQRSIRQSKGGASHYQRNMELLGSYAGTLRINVQYL